MTSRAAFSIRDDQVVVATAEVDQRQRPDDFYAAGTDWEVLVASQAVASGTLRVQLSDVGADNYVVADVIRVERMDSLPGGIPSVPSEEGGGEGEAEDDALSNLASLGLDSQISPRATDRALLAFLQDGAL